MKETKIQKLRFGVWRDTKPELLKIGEIFRILNFLNYKNGWEPYVDKVGRTEWIVDSEPYIHPKYGVWTVNVKDSEGRVFNSTWLQKHAKESGIICYFNINDKCMVTEKT